jgi:hypothetical protein
MRCDAMRCWGTGGFGGTRGELAAEALLRRTQRPGWSLATATRDAMVPPRGVDGSDIVSPEWRPAPRSRPPARHISCGESAAPLVSHASRIFMLARARAMCACARARRERGARECVGLGRLTAAAELGRPAAEAGGRARRARRAGC